MADLILFFKFQTGVVDLDYWKYYTKVVVHGRTIDKNFDINNFHVKIIKQVISLWNKLPRSSKSIETLTLTSFKLSGSCTIFIVRNMNWSIHYQYECH
jgi:hypothetical protein